MSKENHQLGNEAEGSDLVGPGGVTPLSVRSARYCRECGWYRGSMAFVPEVDGGFFISRR